VFTSFYWEPVPFILLEISVLMAFSVFSFSAKTSFGTEIKFSPSFLPF
jgi:hypothetical protein